MQFWDLLVKHQQGDLSYQDSVALFLLLEPKTPLKSFLEVEDTYSRKKLNTLLTNKYNELLELKQKNDYQSFAQSKHKSNPVNLEILPADLRIEYGKLSPIIREISQKHARLANCTTDEQRYALAQRIIELSQQRRAIFNRVDEYLKSGNDIKPLPTQKPFKADRTKEKNFEIEYQLKLLRSQRTKLKKQPHRVAEYNSIVQKIQLLEQQR